MIDARAKTLLKTLIEHYIAKGQPVSSRAISQASGLDISSATVRHVMADLEALGLVASPHTSAGRIPTPRAYRLFVDTMITAQPLCDKDQQLQQQLEKTIQTADPSKIAATAASVLSDLSQFAGVVMTPRRTHVFKQIEFMRLSANRLLLIIVTPEGDIQNRIMTTQKEYSAEHLIKASNYINTHYAGLSFHQARKRLQQELEDLRDDMTTLMQAAVTASTVEPDPSETVLISGEHKLLEIADLSSDMDRLRKLFSMFEQKTSLLQLLDTSSQSPGVQIFIGGESRLVPIEEMSIVTAPYQVNNRIVGTLGVIGPTRMAYQRMISIVDITAKWLSNALSQ